MTVAPLLLIVLGLCVGAIGTFIGAGGGFILVPILILLYPEMSPEIITAVSMALVALNSLVGSGIYMRSKRIDYKAGIIFALATIPGSIIGVYVNEILPKELFNGLFGVILILLSFFLFFKGAKNNINTGKLKFNQKKGILHRKLTDRNGEDYAFSYNIKLGIVISLFVGFFSPLLGIGGGVIHVPAMTQWLNFPVHIATATSHFILAIMATASVIVHFFQGNYVNPEVLTMIGCLSIGIIGGAFIGGKLSHKAKGTIIIKLLSVSLIIIGIQILITAF